MVFSFPFSSMGLLTKPFVYLKMDQNLALRRSQGSTCAEWSLDDFGGAERKIRWPNMLLLMCFHFTIMTLREEDSEKLRFPSGFSRDRVPSAL